MYTQCPKCQSVFMVSETDITAHEGLVRCGNCYSVFNASANLTDDPHSEPGPGADTPEATVSATPVELPPGTSTVSVASDFTFNFVEEPEDAEPQETDAATDAEQAPDPEAEQAPLEQDEELNPFPEPDFAAETIQEEDSAPAEDDSNSLLYFGPDDADALAPEPGNEPEIDTSLLQDPVFNPASQTVEDRDSIPEDVALDPGQKREDRAEWADTEPAAPMDIEDDVSFSGPVISEDTSETGDDFDMPDFSPLEGLEPGQPIELPDDAPDVDDSADGGTEQALQHVETHLDDEALWPGAEFAEEPAAEEEDILPDPQETQRFLADETNNALQAFDNAMANMGLTAPGEETETDSSDKEGADSAAENPFAETAVDEDLLALDDPLNDRPDTETSTVTEQAQASTGDDDLPEEVLQSDPEKENEEPDSVFITSDEDQVDEAYQSINVENDDAFHSSGSNDFPLPDEIEDFDKVDHSDIEKLLQQAAAGQEEIDAKLAETEPGEPEIGTPEIEDDPDDEPQLNPAAQAPAPEDSNGLKQRMGAGIAFVADKLRFGRRSYHGLDTYETQEHQETLLVRQLEHESHGSMFDFISPGIRRALLVIANLVLIAALLFQVGKYFMDDLVQISALRPLLETGCQLAGCVVPEASNPSAVEQLSSKMTVLDGKQDGLRIAVTLINRDNVEQPFPAMELSLTNRAGKIISRRIVRAESYLGSDADRRVMQPGQAEDINILLRMPAVRVDGFELRPVKLHWLDQY